MTDFSFKVSFFWGRGREANGEGGGVHAQPEAKRDHEEREGNKLLEGQFFA